MAPQKSSSTPESAVASPTHVAKQNVRRRKGGKKHWTPQQKAQYKEQKRLETVATLIHHVSLKSQPKPQYRSQKKKKIPQGNSGIANYNQTKKFQNESKESDSMDTSGDTLQSGEQKSNCETST